MSLSIPLDFQLNTINSCQNGSDEINHTLITRVGSNHVILINMNHLYIAINVQRRHARRTLSLSPPQLYRVVHRMISFRARHISTARIGSIYAWTILGSIENWFSNFENCRFFSWLVVIHKCCAEKSLTIGALSYSHNIALNHRNCSCFRAVRNPGQLERPIAWLFFPINNRNAFYSSQSSQNIWKILNGSSFHPDSRRNEPMDHPVHHE